jgi:hypothetical protein
MYAQPLQLGWHTKRADYSAGYGIYIAVGKYELGGADNKGLGMWGHEFSGGATVYLDQKKTFNLSSIPFYEMHSEKKNTSVKVGDIFTAEGGLGKTFYKPIKGFLSPLFLMPGLFIIYKTKQLMMRYLWALQSSQAPKIMFMQQDLRLMCCNQDPHFYWSSLAG